jgi:glycine/D-amino acid oxidase-like deaminating enzyme
MTSSADVVICGAGIAGIATAYHLAVRQGVTNVVIVDERAPLTLTSDKSTECYRNWWPGPGDDMVAFMNRSIDILEELARESHNVFHMNRRGYLYATADPARIDAYRRAGEEAAALGAGELRLHTAQSGLARRRKTGALDPSSTNSTPTYTPAAAQGFDSPLTGADLITDPALIRQHFPYLASNAVAVIHARRCGWFSAQQLGMYMLERAKQHGARFVNAKITAVAVRDTRVQAVQLSNGATITTNHFVIAAGPHLQSVAQLVGVDLPVFNERHVKIAFNDYLGIVPRDAPLVIWSDPVDLAWSDEERALFIEDEALRYLAQTFPAGVHTRPEGGPESHTLLILWTYDAEPVTPRWPIPYDPHYPEIALRGLAAMIPELRVYFDKGVKPFVDGGYYTKTRENRPLIGPLPVTGAYVVGALSGYGLMASSAAGELLAAHITKQSLPRYAKAFLLERYDDLAYQKLLENWGESGQL